MGVKITVTQAMNLSAIRFYKDSLERGVHTGTVWTAGGTILGQVTFSNETASGWQQQALSSPIALQPNTVYVVSVGLNKDEAQLNRVALRPPLDFEVAWRAVKGQDLLADATDSIWRS